MSPSVQDMKKSKFLTQKDVDRPLLVTIDGFEEVNVAKEGAEADYKWALSFKELDKPLVLNSINAQIIGKTFNCDDELNDSIGKKIVLYVDPNVSFGGKLTGGIRVRAPKQAAQAIPEPEEQSPVDDSIPF